MKAGNAFNKKITALIMCMTLVLSCIFCGEKVDKVNATTSQETYISILDATIENMVENVVTDPTNASIGGEWAVFAAARYGYENTDWYDTYLSNLLAVVEAKGAAKLHTNKGTENSRAIIALTAIGYDVTNVCGYNLLEPLNDLSYVTTQGINGPIFALIALDTAGYEIASPTDAEAVTTVATRENLIEYILGREINGGGFSLTGISPDPDITAMALQALAPYYDTNEDVAAAVDRAVTVLSEMQLDDGGFKSWGTENSESTAQVITALSALGIDAATDERFVKEDGSALDALLEYYDYDTAMFMHTLTTGDDQMATEQAAYALVAYYRLKNGMNRIYDMTDAVKLVSDDVTSTVTTTEATTVATTEATTVTTTEAVTTEATTESATTSTIATTSTTTKVAKAKIKTLKKKKAKAFVVKWKKVSGASGYQIRYSTKKSMKNAKKVTAKKSATSKTVKKLKSGKTYYVQVRAYKVVNGVKVYGKWSKKKKVKV